jgi:histidyl-tRNA synthetase
LPAQRVELNLGGGNFKAQFRRADRSGAAVAVVLGEDEWARGVVQIKPLRGTAAAFEASLAEAPLALAAAFARNDG